MLAGTGKAIVRDIQIDSTDGIYRGSFFAMAGPCEVLVDTDKRSLANRLVNIAAQEAWRIEQAYSRYRDDNILYRIHQAQGKPVEVSEELSLLLDFASQCYQLSDGLFDITSGVLRKVWRFDCSDNIPSRQQVEKLMPLIGWNKAGWQKPFISLPEGMEIDLGGIGKEYSVDRAAALIRQQSDVPVLLNFGGDLYATQPPRSRNRWQVGIESIGGSDKTGTIQIEKGGIATSGDARRYLERDGIRYSHVLNPKTGWPVKSAPSSVTVAAPTCIEAGFLSTTATLHGKEARAFLEAQGVLFWVQG